MTARIGEVRRKLALDGPPRERPQPGDFGRVTLPERDCDAVRDLLIAEGVNSVIEIGLAYGSSALAIGEALATVGGDRARHLIIDPMQDSEFLDAGWESICAAGLEGIATLVRERSQLALPRFVTDGVTVDAAVVDGSHIFHEVFVDLYFLRKLVRPGGLVVLDDYGWPSVATAARYYEINLGWAPIGDALIGGTEGRMRALRLPARLIEPSFKDFIPF